MPTTRGFTLIEVSIALVILALGSLSLYSIWSTTLNRTAYAGIDTRAQYLAQNLITEASLLRYASVGTISGTEDEFDWVLTRELVAGTPSLSGFQWEAMLYSVNVTFSFQNNMNTISLSTVRLTRIP